MRDLLAVHRDLLERRRHSMNLVGPGPLDEHYDDAREALTGLNATGTWADLGSGAGFPGIVLAAMYPNAAVDLVDRRQKRCTFLEAVLLEAPPRDAPLRVLCADTADLPDGAYDGLTARALAEPAEVVAIADRLLAPNGRVVLFLQGASAYEPPAGWTITGGRSYTIDHRPRKSLVLTRSG
jgi:16S rRNA (guanine527-N7)-methyltransferase